MQATATIFSPLAVVIPAYNAERVVAQTLNDVFSWLDAAGYSVRHSGEGDQLPRARVLVVDDGSTDRTGEIVRSAGHPVRLLRNEPNRGKGFSVRRGVLAAIGLAEPEPAPADPTTPATEGWVLFMDVDNSTPIRHLDRFAAFAAESSGPVARHQRPVLIASRRTDGARIVKRQYRLRQILGKTFPYVVRTIALPDLSDTQCGFKVFPAEVAARIFPEQRVERFAFDVEVLMLARRLGAPIIEIPADWENPPDSTLRVARDAPKMLLDVFRTVWRLRRRGAISRRLGRPSGTPGR